MILVDYLELDVFGVDIFFVVKLFEVYVIGVFCWVLGKCGINLVIVCVLGVVN